MLNMDQEHISNEFPWYTSHIYIYIHHMNHIYIYIYIWDLHMMRFPCDSSVIFTGVNPSVDFQLVSIEKPRCGSTGRHSPRMIGYWDGLWLSHFSRIVKNTWRGASAHQSTSDWDPHPRCGHSPKLNNHENLFSNGLKLHPQVVKFGNILMVEKTGLITLAKTQPGFEGHHTVSPQVSG